MTTNKFFLTAALLVGALPCKGADEIDALKADMSFFTEPSCRELHDGVGKGDLGRFKSDVLKKVANGLLNGTYDKIYRAADYEPYPSSRALEKAIKLGDGFSRYENITGMVLDAGKHVVFANRPRESSRIGIPTAGGSRARRSNSGRERTSSTSKRAGSST